MTVLHPALVEYARAQISNAMAMEEVMKLGPHGKGLTTEDRAYLLDCAEACESQAKVLRFLATRGVN